MNQGTGKYQHYGSNKMIRNGVSTMLQIEPSFYEWSTRTLYLLTLVQQFTTLNAFEGNNCREEINGITLIQALKRIMGCWQSKNFQPNGIVFIKANKEVIIGKNAYIGARYGYNGAHRLCIYWS